MILLASDLTARSDRPTDRALLLGEQLSASVLLLHVVSETQSDEAIQLRVRDAFDAVIGETSIPVEVEVRRGEVPKEILELASDRAADLIVAGAARYNNIRDYVLGTAVDHLVRHARVPVLVVKRRARDSYRHLLVATDFSDFSKKALETAARLFPEAVITVWHNCHAAYEALLNKEATEQEVWQEADDDMKEFLASADLADQTRAQIRSRVDAGELQDHAAKTLREEKCDLLVLGTHGRSGLAHAAIGSRAAELLEVIDCDVLMVRGK